MRNDHGLSARKAIKIQAVARMVLVRCRPAILCVRVRTLTFHWRRFQQELLFDDHFLSVISTLSFRKLAKTRSDWCAS